MGLLDVFTGKPVQQAAQATRGYLDVTRANNQGWITDGRDTSLAAINQGYNDYRPALTSGYNAATSALGGGYDNALGALNRGYGGAMDAINTGYGDAKAGYTAAAAPLTALAGKYGGATSMGLNALGVNGADAQNTARSAFTAGPAYSFNMDQGLEAINRRRAAGGMLASGNADRDAQVFGAGLASNEYDKWQNALLGFTNPELAATSNAATINARGAGLSAEQANALGLLNAQQGVQTSNLNTQNGMALAELASNYGNNLANSYTNQGGQQSAIYGNAANAIVGNNNAIAGPYSQTYGKEAQAQMDGSANMWKFGMAAAQAAAQAAMGMPPTSLSSLGGGASAANQGVAGGGYVGTGGQIYAGPGFYG